MRDLFVDAVTSRTYRMYVPFSLSKYRSFSLPASLPFLSVTPTVYFTL